MWLYRLRNLAATNNRAESAKSLMPSAVPRSCPSLYHTVWDPERRDIDIHALAPCHLWSLFDLIHDFPNPGPLLVRTEPSHFWSTRTAISKPNVDYLLVSEKSSSVAELIRNIDLSFTGRIQNDRTKGWAEQFRRVWLDRIRARTKNEIELGRKTDKTAGAGRRWAESHVQVGGGRINSELKDGSL